MHTHPRMLYKQGRGEGETVWGHRLDTLTVATPAEEAVALRKGWVTDPKIAIARAKRALKWRALQSFCLRHWQWLVGTTLATTLAILAIAFQK